MRNPSLSWNRRFHLASAASGLLLSPLAAWLSPAATAQDQLPARERVYRSVADWRERIPDELDRPNYKERLTHRGYEVVNDNITVIAGTSLEDARRAAAEATRAWTEAGDLADHFTRVHRNPNFGIGALQVHIDVEPQRDRDAPLTTLNVVGQKSQVVLYTNPGQPQLEQQFTRLREATVLAFLRTTELDVQYPAWVSQGMAGYLAEQGETAVSLAEAAPKPTTNNIGGQQWREIRKTQDVLTPVENERAAAVDRVRFMLEGDDSEHAVAFFSMLKASAREVAARRAGEKLVKTTGGEVQPSFASEQADVQISRLERNFARWQQHPLAGQPVYRPAKGISPEQDALQLEMVLVLKLERRFTSSGHVPAKMKIVSFKKDEAALAVQSKAAPSGLTDPRQLYHELLDGDHGAWATRDVDGSLLMSTNTRRLEALLGEGGSRFQRLKHGDRWVLAAPLGRGEFLTAWLNDNPADATRPEARFEVIDPRVAPIVPPPKAPITEGAPKPPAASLETPRSEVPLSNEPRLIPLRKLTPPGDQPVGQWRAKTVKPNK